MTAAYWTSGTAIHAHAQANPQEVAELDALCRDRLAAYKVPRSHEVLARPPREEAGKIRRLALREERDRAADQAS